MAKTPREGTDRLPPPPLTRPPGLYPQGFNPYAAPADQRGAAVGPSLLASNIQPYIDASKLIQSDPRLAGQQDRIIGEAASRYQTPVLGGVARVMDSPIARIAQPSGNDVTNPLFAYGPAGELTGPTEAVGAAAGKAINALRDFSPAKAAGSFAEALGRREPQAVRAGMQIPGREPSSRELITRQQFQALEDAIGEKQRSGGYYGKDAELVSDMAQLDRLRKTVDAVAPEAPKASEATSAAEDTLGFRAAFASAKDAGRDSFIRDAWARLAAGKKLLFSDKAGTLENQIQQAADAGLIKSEADVRALIAPKAAETASAALPGAGDFYKYQDANLESIPKSFKQRDVGKSLEDAMDIGRGIDTKAVGGYIEEKIGAVEKWLNAADEYRTTRLMKPLSAADKALVAQLETKYAGAPLDEAQTAVRDLTVAIAKQDLPAARVALERVKAANTASADLAGFAKSMSPEPEVVKSHHKVIAPEVAAGGRYVPEVGTTRTLIRDTKTGDLLPNIFMGTDHAADAAAEAAKRNVMTVAESASARKAGALVPSDDGLRLLTSPQLGELLRSTKDVVARQKIEALLGERAFKSAPASALTAALAQIPRDIGTQVRRALRTDEGATMTPDFLHNAPGMRDVLDKALGTAKADVNLANRTSLAQALIDQERANNVRNLGRKKLTPTGNPAVDNANIKIAHAEGDLKLGVAPSQVAEDVAAALTEAVSDVPPPPVIRVESGVGPDLAAVRAATAARRAAAAPEEQAVLDSYRPRPDAPAATPPAPLSDVERQAAVDEVRNTPFYAEGQQMLLPREGVPGGSPPPGGGGLPPFGPPSAGAPKPFGKRLKAAAANLLNVGADLFQGTRNIASGDVSTIGSQSFPMLFKTPTAYGRGHLEGFKSLFKDEAAFNTQQQNLQRLVEREGLNVGGEKGQLFFRNVGTNIQTGEERFAGIQRLREMADALAAVPVLKIPLIPVRAGFRYLKQTEQQFAGSLNAVATYGTLAQIRGLEWMYRRPLTLTEKQGIANNINILLGRGYNFKRGGVDNDTLVAISKIVNGLGFSPENSVARARIIPEAMWRTTKVLNDFAHFRAPAPEDIDYIHGAGAFVASVLTTMTLAAKIMSVNPVLDSGNTNYLKIDLGKQSKELGAAAAVLETAGFHTQTYNGHVYLDPGQGVGQDMRLLTQLVGPFFGHLPTNSKGHAWNPYAAQGTDKSAMQLMVAFAENRLHPGAALVANSLEGRPVDLGDPTQNPITSLLIPMALQAGLSASGLTEPGQAQTSLTFGQNGPSLTLGARLPIDNLTPSQVEKTRLANNIPAVPGMDALSPDRQKQFMDKTAAAVNARVGALVKTPKYQQSTDVEKKALLDTNTAAVQQDTKRKFAVEVATTGTPEEVVPAIAIALGQAPANLDKAGVLAAVQQAGRLTPEIAKQVDALRKQPDPAKPNYDPSAAELIKAKGLVDRWLATPEFVVGTKDDWNKAAEAAKQLRLLVADDNRRKVDPREDEQLQKFYNDLAHGQFFTQFYTLEGSKRPNAVDPVRRDIQKDPLWTLVASSATKLDHPGK
jgi:hypothetical protein